MKGVFDGASRGNPGPAGCGAALIEGDRVVWYCAYPLGEATNNQAEWTALRLLVAEIERRGLRGLTVSGDSQLVINQASGKWKINNAGLVDIAADVIPKVRALGLSLVWVPRERNTLADGLSNQALDGRITGPEGRITEDSGACLSDGMLRLDEGTAVQRDGDWIFCLDGRLWILCPGKGTVQPYKK